MLYLVIFTTIIFYSLQAVENVELSKLYNHLTRNLTIIGGHEARPYEAPYLAFMALRRPEKIVYCGGVLISPTYVLTAAHCIKGSTLISIQLGAHRVNIREPTQRRFKTVLEMKPHEDYDCERNTNDIGIIKLPENVPETAYIQCATLPSRAYADRSYDGKTARAYGWGARSEILTHSKALRYVDLDIVSNDVCTKIFPYVNEKNVCTKYGTNGRVYVGDSGGPLVVDGTVVGLISYGSGSCASTSPSVFVKIAKYLDWIEANTDVHVR